MSTDIPAYVTCAGIYYRHGPAEKHRRDDNYGENKCYKKEAYEKADEKIAAVVIAIIHLYRNFKSVSYS